MSNSRYHSRTFAVLAAVHAELEAQAWPTNAEGGTPVIVFGDTFGVFESSREAVGVSLSVDDGLIEWARMGPAGRDETFTVDVVARTSLPGRTGTQCLSRLEDLSEVVEDVLFDTTNRVPRVLSVDGIVNLTRVGRVAPQVIGTDEGYVGIVTVSMSVQARI